MFVDMFLCYSLMYGEAVALLSDIGGQQFLYHVISQEIVRLDMGLGKWSSISLIPLVISP